MGLIDNSMCNMSDSVLLILQKDVAEIKVALLGNEYSPASGVLPRLGVTEKEVENLEINIRTLNDRLNKIIWFAGGAGATAGFIIQFIWEFWMSKA